MSIPEGFDWKNPDYDAVWNDRMVKLVALRANPDKLEGLKAFYAEHPVEFINSWGCTYDPRNAIAQPGKAKLPTTMPFLLFAKQQEFIRWLYDRWKQREDGVVEKSRDMGVSWCAVGFAVWMWTFHKGSVVGFGSRKEDYVDKIGDPDSLFWKIRMFIDLLPVEFRPRGYNKDKHAPFMRVLNLPGEAAIVGEAGDNIGRGGRTSLYLKDESAFYEHAEAIDAALSQNTNVQIDMSTPNGEGNPFWQKRHGGNFKVFVFDWRDDPRKDNAWYERQKTRMTPVALAAEVDRDYSASISNSFIESGIVTAAMARGPADVKPIGGLRVGLDVARFGDDKCCLTFRRGRVLIKQVVWGKTAIDATAGRAYQEIKAFKERPEQVAVDVIGVGSGAADLLRGWLDRDARPGYEIVVDVNSSLQMANGKHYNLRAFMWDEMREWLAVASIRNDQALRVDLTGLRYGYKGGELLLESKDDAKKRGLKSPDHGDSLALTFAYPTHKKPPPIPKTSIVDYGVNREMGM